MRTVIMIALTAMTFSVASCSGEKDWTCTCTSPSGDKSTYNINKAKKKLAKERCQEYAGSGYNCSL